MESRAVGEAEPSLLRETIGANCEATIATHGEREARVESVTGRRWTYAELRREVEELPMTVTRKIRKVQMRRRPQPVSGSTVLRDRKGMLVERLHRRSGS